MLLSSIGECHCGSSYYALCAEPDRPFAVILAVNVHAVAADTGCESVTCVVKVFVYVDVEAVFAVGKLGYRRVYLVYFRIGDIFARTAVRIFLGDVKIGAEEYHRVGLILAYRVGKHLQAPLLCCLRDIRVRLCRP